MPEPAPTPSESPNAKSPTEGLLPLLLVSVVSLGLSVALGGLIGGQTVAIEAGVGMACAVAGGLFAWALVALTSHTNSSVIVAPMLGLMVRLVVTGAGVALVVMGFGMQKRPVLFAALFGYLMLMATESVLMYRFASSSGRDTRPSQARSAKQDP